MLVEPAVRRVTRGARHDTLEPRVMQVLVVLVEANGAVVGRDELIERCWDGVVVGDNAINRVISRLRRLAAEFGEPFKIETITKVGYRLERADDGAAALPLPELAPAAEAAPPRPVPRRAALGLLGVGVAVVAVLALRLRPERPDEARALIDRGWTEARQNYSGGGRQALAYFQRATELAPDDARAWGALALGYRNMALEPGSTAEAYAMRARGAARRALTLDPNNADALAAEALIDGPFGRWAAAEAQIRAVLKRFPDHWLLQHELGALLSEVGRWNEACSAFARALASDPMVPTTRHRATIALWNAGRLPEAERAVDEAYSVWPAQLWTWMIRFNFYAMTGKPDVALAQAERAEDRPPDLPPPFAPMMLAAATALRTGAASDVASAVELLGTPGPGLPGFMRAMYLGALDAADAFFAVLDRYYAEAADPAALRVTSVLFMGCTARMRSDPRHAALRRRLGLEAYWRQTGSHPDGWR